MYVKANKDTWNHISNSIDKMFTERLSHAQQWYCYGVDKDEFNALCWRSIMSVEDETKVNDLGERFFTPSTSLDVLIGGTSYKLEFGNGNERRLVPQKWHSYSESDRQKVTDPKLVEICRLRAEKIKAINQEKQSFVAMVKGIWDKVPSVNSFIKVWPPGRDLLPWDVISKVDQKVERATADKLEIDKDALAKLNTKLLQARVAA